jgi:5-hydroxyisourate hydrolase-like protein (transthyretin family)
MASTLAHLIGAGSFVLALSSAAMEVVTTVAPPDAQACVWTAAHPESRACRVLRDGRFAMTIDDIAVPQTFVEFSAPSHFPTVVAMRDVAAREVRLDRYPRVQWNGWSMDAAEAQVEWLPAASGAEWGASGLIKAGEEREFSAEVRAVRISSPGASPRTYFFAGPRASLRTPPKEPLQKGGELALCAAKANLIVRVRKSNADDVVIEEKTGTHGCVSFSGFAAGDYDVISANDAFAPLRTRIEAGRSTWLGMLQLYPPTTVRVRIDDSDTRRRYSVSVEPAFVAAAESVRDTKTMNGQGEATWDVRAGSYVVTARPETFHGIEFTANVDVERGDETAVVLRPNYITVWGTATRGGDAASDLALSFVSTEGTRATARTTTDSGGRYEVVLPSAGRWRVVAETAGQRLWKPLEIWNSVPLVERYEWNIELPSGELSGRVVDGSSGEPISDVLVEVRWKTDNDAAGFVTVTSDGEGRFSASGLPGTTVTVGAVAAMARMLGYVPAATPQSVDLASKTRPAIVIALHRSRAAARLAVVDGSGQPVRTAQLFRADTTPSAALLGRADSNGHIEIPEDEPLPLIGYVVAAGHPWHRVLVDAPRQEAMRIVLAAPPAPTQVAFTGATSELRDAVWGLLDSDGLHVPLFYHLLQQNVLPALRGSTATIPAPGSGTYRLWVRRNGKLHVVGTVLLPSSRPILINID